MKLPPLLHHPRRNRACCHPSSPKPSSLNTALTLAVLILLAAVPLRAEQLEPLPPEASRDRFVLPDGISIELVAAEPTVFDPVALCFDASGNLYVVEDRGYPLGDPSGPVGSVALLRDKDGDGRYEERHLFAGGFDFPNGIMPWRGGVLVTAAPHVWYLQDTDGDNQADVRKILLEGFALGGSTQLYVSHPTLSLDNWLHFTNGLSGGTVSVPGHPEIEPVDMGRYDIRFNPLTLALEARAGRAQFGLSFDDFGHKFTCSNRNHLMHSVVEPTDLARNPYVNGTAVVQDIPVHGAASPIFALSEARTTAYAHKGTFTAACGLTIYRGTALPEIYNGNSFVCDPTGNLVHRDILTPEGGTFEARRGPDEAASEFLATTDDWSRPVFLTNGPDGALYLCDMYRMTIEHPTYLPDEIAAVTDFDAGKGFGRVYRITAAPTRGAVTFGRPKDPTRSPQALIDALGHANGWHRDTAQRLLLEDPSTGIVPLLEAAVRNSPSIHVRIRALHLLHSKNALAVSHVLAALRDPAPEVREQGLRLVRTMPSAAHEIQDLVLALANDAHPHVRFACALALGDLETRDADTLQALADVVRADIDDTWTRLAVLSALDDAPLAFAELLLGTGLSGDRGWRDFMEQLSRIITQVEPPDAAARYAASLLDAPWDEQDNWRMAAVQGVLEGVKRSKTFPGAASTVKRLEAAMRKADVPNTGQLDAWVGACLHCLLSDNTTAQAKLHAVHLLGYTDFETAGESLIALLTPQTTQQIQVAAILALNGFGDRRVTEALLMREVWLGFTADTRGAALDGLLANSHGIESLLAALEDGRIQAWSIDPRRRERLTKLNDEELRARATALFAPLFAKSDPDKRYEEYKSVLALAPDIANGQVVFQDNCMSCHRYQEIGYEVGPDLGGIRSQPLESILLHIIHPNRLLVSGYEAYYVETQDGLSYTGLVVGETPSSITLKLALGIETTIPRDNIAIFECSSLSMMPEQLEAGMTRQGLRDLLGFLKGEDATSQ